MVQKRSPVKNLILLALRSQVTCGCDRCTKLTLVCFVQLSIAWLVIFDGVSFTWLSLQRGDMPAWVFPQLTLLTGISLVQEICLCNSSSSWKLSLFWLPDSHGNCLRESLCDKHSFQCVLGWVLCKPHFLLRRCAGAFPGLVLADGISPAWRPGHLQSGSSNHRLPTVRPRQCTPKGRPGNTMRVHHVRHISSINIPFLSLCVYFALMPAKSWCRLRSPIDTWTWKTEFRNESFLAFIWLYCSK